MTEASDAPSGLLRSLVPALFITFVVGACSPATAARARPPAPVPLANDAVEAARTPFHGLDESGQLTQLEVTSKLENASVVCLGEQHDDLAHHALQLQLVENLLAAAVKQGRAFALGMEMFQLSAQPALDAYARFETDESTLLNASEYHTRWGYDFSFYRPIIDLVRSGGGTLLALNAPREWTKSVAKNGITALHQYPSSLPLSEIDLDDSEHREFFHAAMAGHGHGHRAHAAVDSLATDPYYAAQVVWDEVMAASAAAWLSRAPAGAQIVILAGAGHCHRSAIPRRVERRLSRSRTWGVRLLEVSELTQEHVPAHSAFDMLVVATQP